MKQFYLLVLMTILTRFGSQAGPHLVADKIPIGSAKPATARVSTLLDSPHRSMIDYAGNRLFAAELPTDHPPKASGDGIGNGLATAGSPPVVTLSAGPTQTTNSPLDASTGISFAVDRLMQVSDSDSPTLASATFTITNFQSQEDVLYFLETSDDIGNIRSSYNASKGELVLTSAGSTATIAQWQRALRNATYRNIATHPNATQRNVSIVVNDGANNSVVVNKTLVVNVSKPAINEFTATPSSVCTDNTVTFTARTSTISIPYNYTLTNGVQNVTGTISTGNYPNDFTREVKMAGTGTQRFTLKIIADGELVSATTDVAVYSTPTAYSVTGGGTYCTGASSGTAVGLSGSQTGVNYQLLLNGTAVGSALAGTGNPLNFGNQASAGTYTVQATNAIANCSQTTAMEGSVTVTVRQSLVITSQNQSVVNVCGPGNQGQFNVRFTGTGPFTAVFFRDNIQLNQTSAAGSVIGFGFTERALQSGSYQIVVTTPCNSVTTTFAPIVVNALPTPSFSGLASSYCQTTLSVTLSSVVSPTGGRFTIDGSPAMELDPAKLLVGPHTVVYSYTSSSGCTGTVSQTVTIEQSTPEVQALADLYNATNGANWKNKTNWLTSCSPCGWYGVNCTDGRVTSIDLSDNNLIGTLPSSLSALTNLGALQLRKNQLSGSIPASLSALTSLQNLDLAVNRLSGSIPASLSALTNLAYLTLGDNQLSGSIPSSLSALTNLQALILENNQFSGSLPASFSTLTKLIFFLAYNNQLTGSLPASYATLSKLKYLFVNNNRLSGCIPQSLSALCGEAQVELSNNPDLPLGGNWDAFCSNGTGSDGLRVTAAVSENPVCVGKTVTLSFTSNRSYTGNGYRWQGPSGFTSTLAQPSLSLTNANQSGVYLLTVNNGNSSCQTTSSVTLTVNDSPPVSIVGLASRYCQNADAVTLVGSPEKGVFTVDGSPVTKLNPAALSADAHTVVYSYTNTNGCSNTTSQTVTIDPVSVVSITGLASAYCQNAGTQSLNASPAGGVFTIDGQSVANLDPASLSGGKHTVMYSYTNTSGCTSATSQTLTINLPPTVSLTGLAAAYCQDAPSVMLAPLGNPSGGNFTLDGSPATELSPAKLSVGNHSVRYTYTDNNSCSNTATQTVTIKQTPSAPTVVTQSGGPYPAGVSSLTISQNVGTIILAVSGCQGGTITWNGGSANTLAVSTTNLGTQTFTATCTSNGCTSPTATATVTVVAPTLKVLSRDPDNGQLNNNTIKPYLLLQNAGTTPIVYSSITLRYWLTTEDNVPLIFQKNYVQIGSNNLSLKYVALNPARQGATGYIEYSFSGGAGNLAPNGDSGPLEVQLNKQDYSVFNQRDDYSYINNSAYTLNPRITAYQNGFIFYGQEPSGSGSPREAVSEASKVLNVTVLGNPVVGPSAEVEISGVSGQAVELKLIDLQGKTLHGHSIKEAGSVERVSLPLGAAQGLLLLDVSTTNQRRQVKLVRP